MKIAGAVLLMVAIPLVGGFAGARLWVANQAGEQENPSAQHAGDSHPKASGLDGGAAQGETVEQTILAAAESGSDEADLLLRETAEAGQQRQEDLARALFVSDSAATLAFLDGLTDRERARELATSILKDFPASSLPLLTEWAGRQPAGPFQNAVMSQLLPLWIRTDRESAMAAMEKIADQPGAKSLRKRYLELANDQDKMALVEKIPEAERKKSWKDNAASFASKVPAEAAAAIADLPASDERTGAMEQILRALVLGTLPESMEREGGRLGMHLADPVAAVKVASALTDPELQASSFRNIAHAWSSKDSELASRWVASLPRGASRDAAAAGLATELAQAVPASAFTWGLSIDDATARDGVLQEIVGSWQKDDPAAARQAIQDSSLSAAERTGLLNLLNESGE